jgi:hypothetical protein
MMQPGNGFLSQGMSILGEHEAGCHFVEWFLDGVNAFFLQ